MSRKNVSNFFIFSEDGSPVDGTTNPSTISNPTQITYQDNAGIQISWTGTLQGVFSVYVTNDKFGINAPPTVIRWTPLDFGSPVNMDTTNKATGIIINLTQLPFTGMYFSYANTSGTGNIVAKFTIKSVG